MSHPLPLIVSALLAIAVSRGAEVEQQMRAADALLSRSKFQEAAARYQAIMREAPDRRIVWLRLGVCYANLDDPARAEPLLRKYTAAEPRSADGHTALGIVLAKSGNAPDAITELKRALALDASQMEARQLLARVYLQTGSPALAANTLSPVASRSDLPPAVRLVYARALYEKNDLAESLRQIQLLQKDQPLNPALMELRQMIAAKMKTNAK